MSNRPRYVLDTNVIVSALLFKNSQPRQALDRARHLGVILMSQLIWQEIKEVLARPKFERYITSSEKDLFLIGLAKTAQFIEVQQTITACRDPKDNKFLELAVDGSADVIISGDQDLLVLHPFGDISVFTVKQFLELP